MAKYDLNRWIFEINLDDIRPDNFNDDLTNNPCIACGKEVKNNAYMVHLLTNGNLVSSLEDFDNSQGLFVIGSDCKNKLPNNFYWKQSDL